MKMNDFIKNANYKNYDARIEPEDKRKSETPMNLKVRIKNAGKNRIYLDWDTFSSYGTKAIKMSPSIDGRTEVYQENNENVIYVDSCKIIIS